MQFNPYQYCGADLQNSAKRVFLVAPSDTVDLPQVCKSIRVWNPNAAEATFRIITVGGDDVILTVPAKSVWTEPAVITRVMTTNTDAALIIHGYSD